MSNALFAPHSSFLAATLNETFKANLEAQLTLPDKTVCRLVTDGVLEVLPAQCDAMGLVLSAGIHGNETAPIELLDMLVNEILAESCRVSRPTLIILGHPLAMRAHQRFIEFNMNRLFFGTHNKPLYEDSIDAHRAKQLEACLDEFQAKHGITEHYDLHTAIKPSLIERFALRPFTETTIEVTNADRATLAGMGVEALVYQHAPGNTFSSHTARNFGSSSFTVELGKVHNFGENDLESYANTLATLRGLVNGEASGAGNESRTLSEFVVCHEILVDHSDFKLNIEEDFANFTAYPKGQEVCSSPKATYTVQQQAEYLIFPNAEVPIGQRAGLMLKRVDSGQTE